jgi:hypothetical protein
MIQRTLFVALLSAVLLGSTGCHLFHRHKKQPATANSAASAMDNTPSAQVAAEFRERWMTKRIGELTATGMTTDAARTQAAAEYAKTFNYLGNSK